MSPPCPASRKPAATRISTGRSSHSASASASAAGSVSPASARARIVAKKFVTLSSYPRASRRRDLADLGSMSRDECTCTRCRSEPRKMLEVLRIVDIEGDPRQAQDAWLDTLSAGRREMREETVFAKAQRHC